MQVHWLVKREQRERDIPGQLGLIQFCIMGVFTVLVAVETIVVSTKRDPSQEKGSQHQ